MMDRTRMERPGVRRPASAVPPGERPRFLSEAECHDIARRLVRYATGGGETEVHIVSRWVGNVRWGRNQINMAGEDRDNQLMVKRTIHGASSWNIVRINEVSDASLVAAVRRAERVAPRDMQWAEADVTVRSESPFRFRDDPSPAVPQLFFETTYQLDAHQRAAAARQLMQSATAAGMLSAGYIEVSATSTAYITSYGYTQFYQYTWAQYSNTVRDPTGMGSGWAGVDWPDWSKIDGEHLSAVALDKCLKSRNPVTVEPGRYSTILEPQAVCDFLSLWGFEGSREGAETSNSWLHKSGMIEPPLRRENRGELGRARFGERVIDERLTIAADPMDPDLSFPPYSKRRETIYGGQIFHPAIWIERGVLKALPYWRNWAVEHLGQEAGLDNSGAFKVSVNGQTSTIEEMIAATKRGLLVTRFDRVRIVDQSSLLYRGYTRDGLWLIENGKISKPVTNMVFTESIIFALNNVEQVGRPQRTFNPSPGGIGVWYFNNKPVFVPAMKIRDFSFTALSNAI